MFDEINKKFDLIVSEFKQNENSTELVKKAYNLAKELHKGQMRKSGEPYIVHPIEVALILSKLGFNHFFRTNRCSK